MVAPEVSAEVIVVVITVEAVLVVNTAAAASLVPGVLVTNTKEQIVLPWAKPVVRVGKLTIFRLFAGPESR